MVRNFLTSPPEREKLTTLKHRQASDTYSSNASLTHDNSCLGFHVEAQATWRSRNKREKQWLCTCVIHPGAFLCPFSQNNNVKSCRNSRLYGECEHTTMNIFSFLTWTPSPRL